VKFRVYNFKHSHQASRKIAGGESELISKKEGKEDIVVDIVCTPYQSSQSWFQGRRVADNKDYGRLIDRSFVLFIVVRPCFLRAKGRIK